MNQYLIAGMISSDWENSSFVVHPFRLGEQILRRAKKVVTFRIQRNKHLLITALDWADKIAANPHIQSADIARIASCSTGRVRQILRFALLHPEIRDTILKLAPKHAKKRYPERLLRQWTPLSQTEQLSQFKQHMG